MLKVDAEAVRGIGQDVAEAATTLQDATKAAGSGLTPAPRPSSTAATAAQAAEKAWLADLRRLAGQVDRYGRSLTAAAQTYLSTDGDGAEGLRRSDPGVAR